MILFGKKPATIEEVAAAQLCSGCGVCAYLCPSHLEMIDDFDHGRRPQVRAAATGGDADAMAACPGIALTHHAEDRPLHPIRSLLPGWGPVLEVLEGFAGDAELRYAGSSGGVATALALYCLERAGFAGVLHIAARPDVPYLNHTVLSRSRQELLAATGSRYAPASPCDGLQRIEDAAGPCVFIGKPCDVAAAGMARRLRPGLDAKLGLTVAFFCAGTPSTRGTLELLRRMGIDDPASVVSLRYRGNGWPGKATAVFRRNGRQEVRQLSYEESWGLLTHYKQWRCSVCADHTGEFADIAVGDPWYRPIPPDEPGRSLVLVRTERGRRMLHDAMTAGFVMLERADPGILPASQANLLAARGAVWGRSLAARLLGVPAPRFRGMPMFRFWWSRLSLADKARSILGTIRRILRRRLLQRTKVRQLRP
jgi:coenzyme F420 hydrogenase subunit beta